MENRLKAVLYSNRSACYIQLENYKDALEDAKLAVETDALYEKGYFRRGMAFKGLDHYGSAIEGIFCCVAYGRLGKGD